LCNFLIFWAGRFDGNPGQPSKVDMTSPNLAFPTLKASAPDAEFSESEESARYALLQRLTPALQHNLMGNFQFMGMVAALMERRFQAVNPDLVSIHQDCLSLGGASRTVVSSIIDLMTWIEPKTEPTLKLADGVRDCLGLLTTSLRFRGFVVVNEVPEIDATLSSRALRSVLSAALIALSDLSKAPASITLTAQAMPKGIKLSIEVRPLEGEARNVNTSTYRTLEWRDVQSLALADGVKLTYGDTAAQLLLPLVARDRVDGVTKTAPAAKPFVVI
jgi:hypothetical protein